MDVGTQEALGPEALSQATSMGKQGLRGPCIRGGQEPGSAQGPAGLLIPSCYGMHHRGKTGRPPTVRPGSGLDPGKEQAKLEREKQGVAGREKKISKETRGFHTR